MRNLKYFVAHQEEVKVKSFDELREAYRKPTQAEIDVDRRKSGKSKDTSSRYKNMKKKVYGNMMGGLKKEENDLDEANESVEMNEQFVVKYAKNKRGPIYQTKFKTQPEAEKFLSQKKKEGMNGIVSKAGKPVSMQKMADLQKESVELDESEFTIKVPKGGVGGRDYVTKVSGKDRKSVVAKWRKENPKFKNDTIDVQQLATLKKKGDKYSFSKESVDLDENYRTLATHGMGAETKNTINVGRDVDYYDSTGTKRMGKITKMTRSGYVVKDEKDGKSHTFAFHDRAKAKEIMAKSK